MKNRFLTYLMLVPFLWGATSCSEDFLNQDPGRTISGEQLGTSPLGTQGLLSGIYASLRSSSGDGGAT